MLTSIYKLLLILYEYKVHLILDVLTKAKRNEVDMFIISSHISCGLQSLDVPCFKFFKVLQSSSKAFRTYKQAWSIKNHG